MVSRTLQPELLDALPPDNRDAAQSRRDLRLFNQAMGNRPWFRRAIKRAARHGERVLELGAGDGDFGLSLSSAVVAWDGLDLWPRPANWPADAQWHQTDVRDFTGWANYPVVAANLFLHHLTSSELAELGGQISQHARVILASEPARARFWQWIFRLLCILVRANHVSRHDGHVSIAAGFRGQELANALRLDPKRWDSRATISARGVYRLIAVRKSS